MKITWEHRDEISTLAKKTNMQIEILLFDYLSYYFSKVRVERETTKMSIFPSYSTPSPQNLETLLTYSGSWR